LPNNSAIQAHGGDMDSELTPIDFTPTSPAGKSQKQALAEFTMLINKSKQLTLNHM